MTKTLAGLSVIWVLNGGNNQDSGTHTTYQDFAKVAYQASLGHS